MNAVECMADPSSCLNKARINEPIFVLLGRDIAAPGAIRAWAAGRVSAGKNKALDPQIQEALKIAIQMEQTCVQKEKVVQALGPNYETE